MNSLVNDRDDESMDDGGAVAAATSPVMRYSLSEATRTLGKPRFKYVKLAHRLVREIARQRLRSGDRLGTETDFVEEHEFSRTTVRQALAILEKEGFVWRKQRMGTFVKRAVQMDADDDHSTVRGTVLLVVPEREGLDPEADLASFTIFRSIVSELADLGFAVQIVALADSPSEARQQFTRALGATRFDGICAYASNIEPFQDLIADLPLMTVGTRYPNSGLWIDVDFSEVTYRLISYLIEHGHRRIALLCGAWSEDRSFSLFATGYRRAFEAANLAFSRELLHQAYEGESLMDLAKSVLQGQRPTAVFAEESRVCQATLAAASSLNLVVPDDLSVVSCGQMAYHITTPVRMTVVLPDNAALGRQAVRQLVQRIERTKDVPDRIWITTPIVEGDSVRRITVEPPAPGQP